MSTQTVPAGDLLKILGPLLGAGAQPAAPSPAPAPPSLGVPIVTKINGVSIDLVPLFPLISKILSGGGVGIGELVAAAPTLVAIFNAAQTKRAAPHVPTPAPDQGRPDFQGMPDDKIIPPPPKPQFPPIDRLNLVIKGAQYNAELFPELANQPYSRADIDAIFKAHSKPLNRRTKVWFDVSPWAGQHKVEEDEGRARGILWRIEWHIQDPGGAKTVLRDGGDGPQGRIQVLDPANSGIGIGVTNWRFTNGYGLQVNVGDNEGSGFKVWARDPVTGMESNAFEFAVS